MSSNNDKWGLVGLLGCVALGVAFTFSTVFSEEEFDRGSKTKVSMTSYQSFEESVVNAGEDLPFEEDNTVSSLSYTYGGISETVGDRYRVLLNAKSVEIDKADTASSLYLEVGVGDKLKRSNKCSRRYPCKI